MSSAERRPLLGGRLKTGPLWMGLGWELPKREIGPAEAVVARPGAAVARCPISRHTKYELLTQDALLDALHLTHEERPEEGDGVGPAVPDPLRQ
jgi:hypothetical protein